MTQWVVTNHAVKRFAERSGLGVHRLESASQAVRAVLRRGVIVPSDHPESNRVVYRDPRWGIVVFVGQGTTLVTTLIVRPTKGVKREVRVKRQRKGQAHDE